MFTVNRNPTGRDLRFFAWSMLIGFNALGLLLLLIAWWKSGRAQPFLSPGAVLLVVVVVLSAVGTASGLASIVSDRAGKGLYVAWMTITVPIGIVMSTILLTVLFVFLLPLFSLIVRLGDPLRKRLGNGTYWENYNRREPTLERMRRLF
jgi:hypothetical protein